MGNDKGGSVPLVFDLGSDKIRLAAESVGDETLLHLRNERLHIGIVETQNGKAEKRYLVDELDKVCLDFIEIAIKVEMVGVDIGDYGDNRRQLEEGAVRFVCLGHQKFSLSQFGVGPKSVETAADHRRRIDAAMDQNGGDHAGGGGFAVRTGDGDAVLHAHQLGQHFRPRDNRYQPPVRFENLRVSGAHGSGGDHHIGVADVFRPVPIGDISPQFDQPAGHLRLAQVRTGDLITKI